MRGLVRAVTSAWSGGGWLTTQTPSTTIRARGCSTPTAAPGVPQMTSKWADYLVFSAQYDAAGTRIIKVRVYADNGKSVGPRSELLRHQVVSLLASGTTFATIHRDYAQDDWTRGSFVTAVVIDGATYIRTDQEDAPRDDLGPLARF